jgi:hypothetical protein
MTLLLSRPTRHRAAPDEQAAQLSPMTTRRRTGAHFVFVSCQLSVASKASLRQPRSGQRTGPRTTDKRKMKNGARLPIWRVSGGRGKAKSTDVTIGSSAASDSGPPGFSMAKMAVETLEKAPVGAIFRPLIDDFLRVFLRALPCARKLARM